MTDDNKQFRGPVNMPQSLKMAVLEKFAILKNKSQTALQFNISARTVGRIVDELGEKAAKPVVPDVAPVNHEIDSIKLELAKLREMLEVKFNQPNTIVYVKHRERLNMDILRQKVYEVNENNYSNPYRHQSGVSCIDIYGVPTLFNWFRRHLEITPDFLLRHPVSPECNVYPYSSSNERMPKDPDDGKHCNCKACAEWRVNLATQKQLEMNRMTSAGDLAAFHASKLRN